jgi:hypothetical protein
MSRFDFDFFFFGTAMIRLFHNLHAPPASSAIRPGKNPRLYTLGTPGDQALSP